MLLSNPCAPDPRVSKEARSLAQYGYQVTVIAWDREQHHPSRELGDGFTIQRVAVASSFNRRTKQLTRLPLFWLAAWGELGKLRPDVVHCHDLDTLLPGYLFARLHRRPVIFDAHESYPDYLAPVVPHWLYKATWLLERVLAPRADRLITVGEILADHYRSWGCKVAVVGNYQVLPDRVTERRPLRQRLGWPEDELVISYIGNFNADRILLPIVEAVNGVRGVYLVMAGRGTQEETLRSAMAGVPNATFLGFIAPSQVIDCVSASDVVYYALDERLPNNRYSSPNSLYNALAAGCAVLANPVGEIGRIVQEEECGVLVKEVTPTTLRQVIVMLQDRARLRLFQENARRAAERRYHWGRAEETLLQIYQELGGGY